MSKTSAVVCIFSGEKESEKKCREKKKKPLLLVRKPLEEKPLYNIKWYFIVFDRDAFRTKTVLCVSSRFGNVRRIYPVAVAGGTGKKNPRTNYYRDDDSPVTAAASAVDNGTASAEPITTAKATNQVAYRNVVLAVVISSEIFSNSLEITNLSHTHTETI